MRRIDQWIGRTLGICVWIAPVVVTAGFLWMLCDVISGATQGLLTEQPTAQDAVQLSTIPQRIFDFLTTGPSRAGRAGGIGPILVSTTLVLAVCMAAVIPFGLGTAVLLSEFLKAQSRIGRLVHHSLEVLAGVPSIVFGLFGNAFFCRALGLKFSIISGGLTLACMALPLAIRSAEEAFRAVPDSQRQAAMALGLTRWSTMLRVILPQAAEKVAVGIILGIGRALAETAALIFTSGYVDRMPRSLFDSGRTLSVHIYDLSMNVPGGDANAYKTSLVLVLLLLVINLSVRQLAARLLHKDVMSP